MAFRFERADAGVEAGVRRVACEQIDRALAAIRDTELPPARAIHIVRRRCKALRGLLRLVRPIFPAYAHENAALRDAARLLAGSRDGTVLGETLDALAGEPDDALDPARLKALRRRLAGRTGGDEALRAALDACGAALLPVRVRAAGWIIPAHGWAALAPGLERGYRQARRAMKHAVASGEAEASHAWRKHVKYHGQHMRLLRALGPDDARRRARRAETLGDLLGTRHDLDLLAARLEARPGPVGDAAMIALLRARAGRSAGRIARKARARGARLFDETPARFMEHWAGCW